MKLKVLQWITWKKYLPIYLLERYFFLNFNPTCVIWKNKFRGVDFLVLSYYQITLKVKLLFAIKVHIYNYFQLQNLIANDKFLLVLSSVHMFNVSYNSTLNILNQFSMSKIFLIQILRSKVGSFETWDKNIINNWDS